VTRNVLLTGGPGHDFAGAATTIVACLDEVGIDTTVVTDPDAALAAVAGTAGPDVALLTVHALRWRMGQPRYASLAAEWGYALDPDAAAALDRFVRAGGALLALHTAVICFDADPTWHRLCGASWAWGRSSHPPRGRAEVRVTASGERHPITAGLDAFSIDDEIYGDLDQEEGLVPLLTSAHGGRSHPVLWARQVGEGRVVTDLLGHDRGAFTHPTHRAVVARAATWATRRGDGHG